MGKAGHGVFCYRRRYDIITSEGPYTKHVLIDGTKDLMLFVTTNGVDTAMTRTLLVSFLSIYV